MKKSLENKDPRKRVVYIALVMTCVASFFVLCYLVFILINFQGALIKLDERSAKMIGGMLAIIGALFGQSLGKKWWQLVYVERGRGAFLKVKK